MAIGTVVQPAEVIDQRSGRRYRATALGDQSLAGVLVTTDGGAEPSVLEAHRRRGVLAVDMESAGVAAAAEAAAIPWSVIRSVSDRPADGVVDRRISKLIRPDGTPDLAAVARFVGPAPWRAARLARLGRDAGIAARAAAAALADALGS